jgi:NADH-quinone oxidoreductase subunit L
MPETSNLWLIPGFPLAGAVIAGLLGPRYFKERSHAPVVSGALLACAFSLWVLARLIGGENQIATSDVTWFSAGHLHVSYKLVADPLTAIMLSVITFIGSWIAIFSIGYAKGEEGYPRYFAVMGLFLAAMCILVMADNLLLLYAGWEGVGLCSYLLIGFWFTKPSAAQAARKAFLVTRLGDAGLILGIFLLWLNLGYTLNFSELFERAPAFAAQHPGTMTVCCLLLFCGCVGKSAQFPLHVWLPDAMEGPTPVSALIHAATMVTAGVYLVARTFPLFALSPAATLTVACIGAFTALLAALIALTQHDLKRVMAYSTVSQLGYMFLGLGSGSGKLAALGVVAAIFHLFTHAYFKALLFLASGSVMHAMGNVIDMRRIGGLRKVMPQTHATFLCGALSLAGFPLFSGFWSKDDILDVTLLASHGPNGAIYFVLFAAALLTAFLTAFYTFRAYFRTFWGEEKIPEEAYGHGHAADTGAHHGSADAEVSHEPAHGGHGPHESPPVMTIPLWVLAVGAVFVGIVVEPFTHWFSSFLERTPALHHLTQSLGGPAEEAGLNYALLATSSLVALAGIATAWLMYIRDPALADRMASAKHLYDLSQHRFYLDEIYAALIVRPLAGIAVVSRFFDGLVDGLVDLVGRLPRGVAFLLRPIQNGLVQFYALAMVMGLTVFLGILALRGGR